ncbi:MAG: CIA30 family protein [bacterium]|jgi:NADH dehydrogenase [ubiquinone] 1 alpha subcomplex assembly factor 1
MIKLLILFGLLTSTEPVILYDFNATSTLTNWMIVDDGVMGGRSKGNFKLSEEGHAVFFGDVSLENNGGFSSVRYRFDEKDVSSFSRVELRVKGDGKRYQFRVKSDAYDRPSYITYFETSGAWETIIIHLDELYPSWRGMRLNLGNYPGESMEEIAFLIANKKAESFRLEIDRIVLK